MNIAIPNMHLHGVDIDLDCYNQRCLLNKDFEENAKIKASCLTSIIPNKAVYALAMPSLKWKDTQAIGTQTILST